MEDEATDEKISLSSHLDFVNWVAREVGGLVNHYRNDPIKFEKKIPDVCVVKNNDLLEIHEVEVVHITREKIIDYSYPRHPKAVLWVCLPDLGHAFNEVRVVAHFRLPEQEYRSISLSPNTTHKKTVVWIRCQNCDLTFDSLDIWENHFAKCEVKQNPRDQVPFEQTRIVKPRGR